MPNIDEKPPIEISLSAKRNGDTLGHDHLDNVTVYAGQVTIVVDKEKLIITLGKQVPIYGMYHAMGHVKDTTLTDTTIIDSSGRVIKIFDIE